MSATGYNQMFSSLQLLQWNLPTFRGVNTKLEFSFSVGELCDRAETMQVSEPR
jgi:hypothetical protein